MWQLNRWQRNVHRVLITGLILSGVYLVVVFVERAREPKFSRPEPTVLPLSPDYYVVPPKSYVRSLADVQALVGKPLWVREGYRWTCQPGPQTLGPIEKLVPTRAFQRAGQVWLEFMREGRPCSIAIAAGDQFFLDEIFYIKDPREIYRDWKPETWRKIEERQIEPEMTETQITFALGYGALVEGRAGEARTIVDYAAGDRHARVTYEYGVAKRVEPLP